MSQFADRQSAIDWLDAHARQTIRIGAMDTTLRLVGTVDGVQQLDACSTEISYSDLRTGVDGLHVALSLHDDALAVHVLVVDAAGGRAPVALPLSIPYGRLRLDPADAPEHEDGAKAKEPDFSPYELLHFPRSG